MRLAGLFLSLLLFLGLSPNAWSQTEPVSDSLVLGTVVVTASKVKQSSKESAQQVRIIDRATVAAAVGKDLSQLLQDQAGLTVNGAFSNPGKDKSIFLRGATNAYTLILVDGLPINDPSGVGGAFDLRLLSLDQIERIEILPGGQSTLYGSDAVAGVINIISKSGKSQGLRARIKAAYGSLNTSDLSVGLNGGSKDFGYVLSYDRFDTEGISEALPPSDTSNFDKDGFQRWASQLRVQYAGKNVKIAPFIRYHEMEGDFDAGAFTDSEDTYSADVLQTGLRSQFRFNKVNLYANYNFNKTNSLFDFSFGESKFGGRIHLADVYANVPVSAQFDLLLGTEYRNETAVDELAESNPNANTFSPYVNANFHSKNGLRFGVGSRLNHHSKFGDQLTYSLALAYPLSDHLQVFTSFGTAFKAPTLSELFGPFGANPDLKPQTSQSLEGGLRLASVQSNTFLEVRFFQRKIEDLIVFTFDPGYLNQDEQNDNGFEVSANWSINDQISLRASYSYLDGELQTNTATGRDTTFNNLIRRPTHQFKFGADIRPSDKFHFQLSAQNLGARTDLFFNPDNFFAAESVDLESYFLLNLYGAYQVVEDQIRLFVDLKNITDASFQEVYGFSSLGFNARVGVIWEIGK